MEASPKPFEPTSAWCYHFARYQAIPEILTMQEVVDGNPVKLIDLSKQVLDLHLSKDQQALKFPRKKAKGELSVAALVKFYIPFIAGETRQLTNLGGGMFCLPSQEEIDEVEAEAIDAGVDDGVDDGSDLNGWIYTFTFPMLKKIDGSYPIKVGKTSIDVETRVKMQCKNSAAFEAPCVLKAWNVKRMSRVESAIHSVLKARGKWRQTAPGMEWFDTTVSEVDAIVQFVTAA